MGSMLSKLILSFLGFQRLSSSFVPSQELMTCSQHTLGANRPGKEGGQLRIPLYHDSIPSNAICTLTVHEIEILYALHGSRTHGLCFTYPWNPLNKNSCVTEGQDKSRLNSASISRNVVK